PLSLVLNYGDTLIGASAYDAASGLVLFDIPQGAPRFKAGKTTITMAASDYQETKNINTPGDSIMPNTAYLQKKLSVLDGPSVTWVIPPDTECAVAKEPLVVVAESTKKIRDVTFTENGKSIGVDKTGPNGIYSVTWKTGKLSKGTYHLAARVVDAAGRSTSADLNAKICK